LQEHAFDVFFLAGSVADLRYLCADHLINVLENGVNSTPLLLFFLLISDAFKSHTFQLEKDAMGEVKVILAGLHDEIDQLLHVRVISLQVE